jgi:hypothetical protein
MPYYNRKSRGYGYNNNADRERALEHIRQAQRLSALLGGTDETVKQYLFNLPRHELKQVLAEYGLRHGHVAQEYAEQTMPKWRTKQVTMSGMVAERLYLLLPPRMPIGIKYQLAEELWHHVGPSSSKILRFGINVPYAEIIRTVDEHISAVVLDYHIPESLQRRFDWLTSDDVKVKQQLLNHLRNLDKRLVIEAASLQAASMLNHLSNELAGFTQLYTHSDSW